jgi:hypothetical protein
LIALFYELRIGFAAVLVFIVGFGVLLLLLCFSFEYGGNFVWKGYKVYEYQ